MIYVYTTQHNGLLNGTGGDDITQIARDIDARVCVSVCRAMRVNNVETGENKNDLSKSLNCIWA